ncbi:MAG: DUF1971 domain-containing protein [Sphingomonadales bacterium]|nr:DUF1971 domain-containing protein [Sphingomonadales bacterium]MDE2171242.1 DUF1971 domain-containing protein [Sphingomonadales bacterium]
MTAPYKATPVFDEISLPQAIRNAHQTKPGVWGLLRVLEGEAVLVFHDGQPPVRVSVDQPATIPPEAVHHVEVTGPVRMQVEFYHDAPME